MRVFVMAVAGLLVAGVGQAQTGSASTAQLSQYVVVGTNCPGQLTAQRRPTAGETVWTVAQEDKGEKDQANKPSLGVHVAFQGVKTPMRSLELRVSYLPSGLRLMPVDPKQGTKDMQESDKTFVLQQKAAVHVVGDLLVGAAATITRVHLMSVTFADGSVWRAPSADACSVVPNGVMEVAAK
jgi:hypothetical protein